MTERRVKGEINFKRMWILLLGIVSLLFFIVGLVMILADDKYFSGFQYLLSAVIFSYASFLIKSGKYSISFRSPDQLVFLSAGVIFSIVGLSINTGIWGLGIVLFCAGIFRNRRLL